MTVPGKRGIAALAGLPHSSLPMPAPLRILIAPNALKGSLSARAAAEAIADGVRHAAPDSHVQLLPVADGGDGLLEVLEEALAGERIAARVTGPAGTPLDTYFIYSEARRLALLEMASAAGLTLLRPDQYDPLRTTTRGVGQLIRAALDHGARHLLLGIGGSATNDGGIGMAADLGVVFRDADGHVLPPTAEQLSHIARIDIDGLNPRLRDCRIQVICDVDNPLLGPEGATYTFASQKGARPEQLPLLEAGLSRLADLLENQLGIPLRHVPGSGAAGGLGAGALAFLNAELQPGTDVVFELLDFDAALDVADLVITAEGRLDAQSLQGKAPVAVALRAHRRGIPCLVLAGSVAQGIGDLSDYGITAHLAIAAESVSLENAMRNAAQYLAAGSEQLLRTYLAGGVK